MGFRQLSVAGVCENQIVRCLFLAGPLESTRGQLPQQHFGDHSPACRRMVFPRRSTAARELRFILTLWFTYFGLIDAISSRSWNNKILGTLARWQIGGRFVRWKQCFQNNFPRSISLSILSHSNWIESINLNDRRPTYRWFSTGFRRIEFAIFNLCKTTLATISFCPIRTEINHSGSNRSAIESHFA